MKKVLFLALGMLLIPFTAFGMQMMADSDMESITGQSGVAISLENVQVYSHTAGEEIWFETDGNAVGITWADNATYSYLYVTTLDYQDTGANFDPLREDAGGFARGDYDGLRSMAPLGMPQNPKVLTIRVTNPADNDAEGDDRMWFDETANNPYVEIGLPTLELVTLAGGQDIMSIYVVQSGDPLNDGSGTGAAGRIGRLHTTDADTTTAIFGGRIGITAYNNVNTDNVNAIAAP